MSVVIRLKVPIEMHYTVIPMGTSKVNSSLQPVPPFFRRFRTAVRAYHPILLFNRNSDIARPAILNSQSASIQ